MLSRQKITGSLIAISTILVAIVAILFVSSATSEAAGAPERFIVTFEEGDFVNGKAKDALQNNGGQVLRDINLIHGFVVSVPEQALAGISNIAGVKSIEKDVQVFAQKPPSGCQPWPDCKDGSGTDSGSNQPPQTLDWGVDRIDADLAWPTSLGAGVKVAVIDTGIDKDHEDLVSNIKGGINFVISQKGPAWKRVLDPNQWNDDNGHGTHVAGTIAAVDNEIGVIGVAPEADLYAVKVLDAGGSGYISDVISGIDWSVDNDMDVINMSLGCDCNLVALEDAVNNAHDAGVVVVASAGNSGDGNGLTNDVIYPAKYDSVIAVAATASDDSTPSWSSEGSEVELAAPGRSILSTWNDGLYNTISGTSMASPHVAGTVALLLATPIVGSYDTNGNSMWDPEEVRARLIDTADDLGSVGHDNFYGYGLVDAEESVTGIETN